MNETIIKIFPGNENFFPVKGEQLEFPFCIVIRKRFPTGSFFVMVHSKVVYKVVMLYGNGIISVIFLKTCLL